jgi:hypothetical protein
LSAAPLWKEPSWLADMPLPERAGALLAYHLGIAALHASPAGTMKELADLVGWPESSFSVAKKKGALSPRICIKIEQLLGRDVMPRELLCPEFFSVEGRQS